MGVRNTGPWFCWFDLSRLQTGAPKVQRFD
jgi:hypothetical protein